MHLVNIPVPVFEDLEVVRGLGLQPAPDSWVVFVLQESAAIAALHDVSGLMRQNLPVGIAILRIKTVLADHEPIDLLLLGKGVLARAALVLAVGVDDLCAALFDERRKLVNVGLGARHRWCTAGADDEGQGGGKGSCLHERKTWKRS